MIGKTRIVVEVDHDKKRVYYSVENVDGEVWEAQPRPLTRRDLKHMSDLVSDVLMGIKV